MYIFFNSNKELTEYVLDNLTAGSQSSNEIYAYWDNTTFTSGAITSASIKYKKINGEELSTEYTGTIVNDVQVPESEDKDYKCFQEYTNYKMAKFSIPDAVLSQEGAWIAIIRMLNSDGSIVYAMNDMTFMVKGSYIYDVDISESQYNYLLSLYDDKQDKLTEGEHITIDENNVISSSWRGIQDNLTSDSSEDSLSAKQGKILNESKQENLVSGTNIKTINGNSILGNGDLEVASLEGLATKLDKAGGTITGNLNVNGDLQATNLTDGSTTKTMTEVLANDPSEWETSIKEHLTQDENTTKVSGAIEVDGAADFNSNVNANNDLEVGGELIINGIDKLTNAQGSQLIKANPTEESSGTIDKIKIGDFVYAVEGQGGTTVEANPTDEAIDDLSKLKVGETVYDVSIVDANPSGEATNTIEKIGIDGTIYSFVTSWDNVANRPTNVSEFTNDAGYITSAGSCNYANSAGSVDWSNVANHPTALSSFTNDSGYITSSGSCNYANSAGAVAWDNVTSKPSTFTPANHRHNVNLYRHNVHLTADDLDVTLNILSDSTGGYWTVLYSKNQSNIMATGWIFSSGYKPVIRATLSYTEDEEETNYYITIYYIDSSGIAYETYNLSNLTKTDNIYTIYALSNYNINS